MADKLLSLAIPLLKIILDFLSPHIKQALVDFVYKLHEMAKATPNPVDDLLVAFLMGLLSIPYPSEGEE